MQTDKDAHIRQLGYLSVPMKTRLNASMFNFLVNQLTVMCTSGARRNVWKANLTDRQAHKVIIVHTCGSCKISTPRFIDDFDLYFLQFKIDIIMVFGFKFSQQPHQDFTYQWLDDI